MSSKKKVVYNHAFDLCWSVPKSKFEDPYDCLEFEKSKVFEALADRIAHLSGERGVDPKEYLEAMGHVDTYEEESSEDDEPSSDEIAWNGEHLVEAEPSTFHECLGYIVSQVTWDDACPHQLKPLRIVRGVRNFIDLETLSSWSNARVKSVALEVYADKRVQQ